MYSYRLALLAIHFSRNTILYCLTSGLREREGSIIPKRSGLYYCDFVNLSRLGIQSEETF